MSLDTSHQITNARGAGYEFTEYEMNELPVGITQDISICFGYMPDKTYQERSHEYLETYQVMRSNNDTAVQRVVLDIARRAFEAGKEYNKPAPKEYTRAEKKQNTKQLIDSFVNDDGAILEISDIDGLYTVKGINQYCECNGIPVSAFIRKDKVFLIKE